LYGPGCPSCSLPGGRNTALDRKMVSPTVGRSRGGRYIDLPLTGTLIEVIRRTG
jgi:hypothetical protein